MEAVRELLVNTFIFPVVPLVSGGSSLRGRYPELPYRELNGSGGDSHN